MNIITMKRKLSEFGIGNPLNKLVYTNEEIEEKKKTGEIVDLKDPIQKEIMRLSAKRRPKKNHSKDYEVGYSVGYSAGRTRLRKVLLTKDDVKLVKICEVWIEWNHKKIDGNRFAYIFGNWFNKEVKAVYNKNLTK